MKLTTQSLTARGTKKKSKEKFKKYIESNENGNDIQCTKCIEYSKSSSNMKVYSHKHRHQEKEKYQINNLILQLKELDKEQLSLGLANGHNKNQIRYIWNRE